MAHPLYIYIHTYITAFKSMPARTAYLDILGGYRRKSKYDRTATIPEHT
jgi:hypothetical protein